MSYEYVLVDIWVPAANIRRDMFVPYQMPLHLVIKLIAALLTDLGVYVFEIQEQTRLYRLDTKEELFMEADCNAYCIENGETLLLI